MYKENVVLANGTETEVTRGVLPEFLERLREHLDLEKFEHVPLEDAPRQYVKAKLDARSSTTACAAFIALNGTDICVANVGHCLHSLPPSSRRSLLFGDLHLHCVSLHGHEGVNEY